MAGQIPPQLKKAIGRRVGTLKKASMTNAPPSASGENTSIAKLATFAQPGFKKSNTMQVMKGAAGPDAGAPQAFTGNRTKQNTKEIIARRLKKQ